MLTALIFICAVTSSPDIAHCDRSNASDILVVPQEFSNPAACFFAGQAYLASIPLGEFDTSEYRLKIVCVAEHSGEDVAKSKVSTPRTRRRG